MSKNSAASKGYRKYQKKTWWEKKTKEEQQAFSRKCVCAGIALLVIILLIVFIPKIIDNSKNLKVVDGAVQAADNVLTCNLGTSTNPKYRRIARIDSGLDGYEKSADLDGVTDANVRVFTYRADASMYTIMAAKYDAETGLSTYQSRVVALGDIETQSELETGAINGRKACAGVTLYVPVDMMGTGEEELPPYRQSGIVYIDSTFADMSVVCNVVIDLDSKEAALSDEDMTKLLTEIASTVEMAEQ